MSAPPSKYGESFSEWFSWILSEAEIYDYGRYPVKGVGIWLPYGFQIRRRVIELIRKLLDERGHEEILLPMLIPETLFRKESEHVRGFEGEVFWVTRAGLNELDIKLVLRPTSETALSYMESLWIKSYKQLPKKFYQIVSIFRYETKMTKPMIRVREVTTFKEAHTAHETFEDAERQVLEAIEIYRKFFDELGIPYIISRRPQWDKFFGAVYTIAFDTLLPDGRTLQIGTVHNLGQAFSSVFEIKFQRRDETIDVVWQTSYGISERVIATIIAYHSDERGLILPPNIAPIQVVIVPIPGKSERDAELIKSLAHQVLELLTREGIRAKLDDREDMRPAEKFYEWERKGVPLRIEIGPREAKNNAVTIFRRDTMSRESVDVDRCTARVKELLSEIASSLKERAWRWFREHIGFFERLEDAIDYVKRGGIAEVPWCGDDNCAQRIVELFEGIHVLGTPLPVIERQRSVEGKKCVLCQRDAVAILRIAKRY